MLKRIILINVIIGLLFILPACSLDTIPIGGTYVWIDAPIHGLTFSEGSSVRIEGHASSTEGISSVEIYINSTPVTTITTFDTKGNLAHFEYIWTPPGPGEYIIHAAAIAADEVVSDPDSVSITIGDVDAVVIAGPSDTPTEVLTATDTPTLQSPEPQDDISISDTPTITIEPSITITGTYPPTHTFTPVPPTHTFTPVPPTRTFTPTTLPDTTGPAAPAPVSPINGITLGCTSLTTLTWNPASDPSGISEYRVQIQRSWDQSTWNNHTDNPWNGLTSTSLTISVECGAYYRWQVMAVDGVSNPGAFTAWQKFTVTLE